MFGSKLSCQCTKISYDYDVAGNRISRKVVTLPPPQSVKQHPPDSIAVDDMLAERTIRVYPNPTKGALGVEITGGDWDENIDLILFSGQGIRLYHAKAHQGINPIDMTVYPEGWYILRVQAGEQRKEFKVEIGRAHV